MKNINDATTAIIKKFESKKINLDKSEVEQKLNTLVNDFGIPLSEAEDTVLKAFAKKHDVKMYEDSSTITKLGNIDIPNIWVNLEATCVKVSKPISEKIYAMGVLEDASGSKRFTAWARKSDTKLDKFPKFLEGHAYRISNAVVNEFKGDLVVYMNIKTLVVDLGKSKEEYQNNTVKISDIETGVNSVEGKVVKVFDIDSKNSDKIASSGIIGDESGVIKYTIWRSNAPQFDIKEGKCYRMDYTETNVYNEKIAIIANELVTEIDKDIEVKSNECDIIAIVSNVKEDSGVIKRCKVEGCKKILDRRLLCDAHGKQTDYDTELRIRCGIDDGNETKYATIKNETVTKMTGITYDYALDFIKDSPLGNDELYSMISDKIIGRYFKFKCRDFGANVIIDDAEEMRYADFVEDIGNIEIGEQKTLCDDGECD